MKKKQFCVFGAGNIGCYIGGRLAATGCRVTFIGRKHIREELRYNGLCLTDLIGGHVYIPPDGFHFETQDDAAGDADLVLVTVKSS